MLNFPLNLFISMLRIFAGSGRVTQQHYGDDMSSNIIIGVTPSQWNNEARGNSITAHKECHRI